MDETRTARVLALNETISYVLKSVHNEVSTLEFRKADTPESLPAGFVALPVELRGGRVLGFRLLT